MAPGANNKPNDSEQPRPERREDAFEAQQQRAEQNSRVDVSQNIEQYTADSKKSFQKPKEENSSGISRFGFNPTAKINPEPSTEVNKMQSAAEHFEHMATQEKLEKEQLRDAEFRAKFGDPARLQGNISETRLPAEMLAAQPEQERSFAQQAARTQEIASAEISTPTSLDSSIHRDSQQSVVKDNSAIEDNALRSLKSGSLYSDGPPRRPETPQSQETINLAQIMPPKIEAQEKDRAGKILAGEIHGFVNTAVGAITSLGDLIRMGAATGPVGALNIDLEGKQKLQSACSGISDFSRIVLQFNTTLNNQSLFYGKNFDPEGRQMAVNFAANLPAKFKSEIEQFKSAPLETQSRKATELLLNLGLLASGVGEASKLGGLARTAEEASAISKASQLANESKIAEKFTSDMQVFSAKLKLIGNNKLNGLVQLLDEKWPRLENPIATKALPVESPPLELPHKTTSLQDNVMQMGRHSDDSRPRRGNDKAREINDAKQSRIINEALEIQSIMKEGWDSKEEARVVKYLRDKGETITKNEFEHKEGYGRQTDGVEWELKNMSNAGERKNIVKGIVEHAGNGSEKYTGTAHIGRVLIDARSQSNLTESLAEKGMQQALADCSKLKEIRILGKDFDIGLKRRQEKVKRW